MGLVVALDSTAAPHAADIVLFVRGGGSAVITAAAVASVPALARLASGGVGASASVVLEGDSVTRERLPLRAVVAPRVDAVPLERRGHAVAVAARRVDAGRVAQVGYEETWRWRMAGGDSGAVAHRRWWSALAASVAYVPVVPRSAPPILVDPAPLASLVHALGPASPVPAGARPAGTRGPASLSLLLLAFTMLLAEWLSRRLRGAP